MKKRLLSTFMALLMVCSMVMYLPGLEIDAKAANNIVIAGVDIGYAAGQYFSKNGSACNCHNRGICLVDDSKCNCKTVSGCAQCYAFALWCQNKLFGYNDIAYKNKFYSIGSLSASNMNATNLKNLLYGKAKPGAHIRTGSTNHSMIITSINENGFSIAQANGSNNKEYSSWSACRIGTQDYTWSSYVSSTYGKRGINYVNMPYDYHLIDDPIPVFTKDSNYPTPISAYPAATSGKITVYNSSLNAYDLSSSYISWNDLCSIQEVYTNGYCKVKYPTSSGSRIEYAKTSSFITNGVTPYNYKPSTNLTTYTRSNMSNVFGSAFTTDNCKVVGKSGDKLELIYPISGGYKLGWVTEPSAPVASDFPTPLHGYNASPSVRTTVYQSTSSMGTYYGQIFVDDYCTLDAVNVSQNWIKVTYPVSSGTKTGYVYLNEFVPDSSRLISFYKTGVTTQTTTYRKSDMATSFGYVSVGDTITVVGKSGNKLQVIYPLDSGGYKIAWIYNTNVKKNLTKIAVTSNPSKTSYLEGDNLNTSGLVVTAYYDDGSTSNVTGSCSMSGYSSTPGSKTVTVTYSGKTTAFSVTVNSKFLSGIKITSNPSKTSYAYGETINLSGLTVQASYNNGTTSNITDYYIVADDEVTKSAGTKNIPVSYTYNGVTKTTTFNITVSTCTHNYSSTVVKAATCGETGTRRYTCSICGNTYDETIAKTSTHNFGSWTTATAATCSKDGCKTRKCTICGYADSQIIKATGHQYVETVVVPTTEKQGYTEHTCTVCGDSYKDNYIDKIHTHSYTSKVTKAATCTNDGVKTYTCSCGKSYTEVIQATGHKYTVTTVAPTATEAGYDIHTCSLCGKFYIDNVIPAGTVSKPVNNPVVTYVKGDGYVTLKWDKVEGADKYAVYGFMSNKWKSIAQGSETSYTLKNLTAGKKYKVVVVARSNGKWNTSDLSNALVVTPKEKVPEYPVIITRSVVGNSLQLKWTAVKGAQNYGIAYYTSGGWKMINGNISANTVTFTANNVPSGTYKMVVCAKVNGKWDTSNIASRAFYIAV